MKTNILSLSLVVCSLVLSSGAYANQGVNQEYSQDEWGTKRRRCECSVTDSDYGHFYGSSNQSLEVARNRAFRDCWSRSTSPGTCTVASYDPCKCHY